MCTLYVIFIFLPSSRTVKFTHTILICSVNSGYLEISKDKHITNLEIILINLIQYINHLKTNLVIIKQGCAQDFEHEVVVVVDNTCPGM